MRAVVKSILACSLVCLVISLVFTLKAVLFASLFLSILSFLLWPKFYYRDREIIVPVQQKRVSKKSKLLLEEKKTKVRFCTYFALNEIQKKDVSLDELIHFSCCFALAYFFASISNWGTAFLCINIIGFCWECFATTDFWGRITKTIIGRLLQSSGASSCLSLKDLLWNNFGFFIAFILFLIFNGKY